LLVGFAACGGAGAGPEAPPGYGPRVAQCVDVPRPLNDVAQQRMQIVPAGPAVQGSTKQERAQASYDYGRGGQGLFDDEVPVRRAFVHGFRMDRGPVTAELYAEFAAACGALPPDAETFTEQRWAGERRRFGLQHDYNQLQRFLWQERTPPEPRSKHPMVLVSQDEAGFYCAWRGARLPTEDEWERAARGATGNIYPWGNRYDPFRVNTAQRGKGDTIEVGSLPQGNAPEGFTDMGGLVLEWTSTPWVGSPDHVVVKGNAWDGRGGFGRGAARRPLPKPLRDITVGFRCAASP
jgi:formylglycine-generating enzyme required for sulfatase activity